MRLLFILLLIGCSDKPNVAQDGGFIIGGSIMRSLPLSNYRGHEMENRGVSATSCTDAVEDLLEQEPRAVVIIGCGHNSFEPEQIKADFSKLIAWCTAHNVYLVIVNINPIPVFPERLESIIEINDWLDEQSVEVIDFFNWSLDHAGDGSFKDDGLHPSAIGYKQMITDLFEGE